MPDPNHHMSHETAEVLDGLGKEDMETLKQALPVIRMILAFGTVSKWLIVTVLGLAAGAALLGDSALKILGWFKSGP